MKLRSYQEECLQAVFRELESVPSTLATLATGLGKTVIFSHVAARWPNRRVLIVAHREELVFQACRKAEAVLGSTPDVEMGELRADATGLFTDSKVIVGSVQTISQPGRLERFDPDDFGLLVVDEAHHCVPANKTYGRIVEHFRRNPDLRLLGVTATPDRADEKALGAFFGSVAFEYGIREGIEGGWLVPIDQQFVMVTDLDFSSVRSTAGDLNEGDLERVMMEEKILHRVVGPTIELAGAEPTLVFATSVAHAQQIADIINRHPEKRAVCLHGGTPKEVRRQKLREFSQREYQFLVGCGLFLEGFDEPSIAVVAMARPTKSRTLYCQAIGRGTRTLPGVIVDQDESLDRREAIACSAKPRLLVIDFVGNSGKHKLVTCADALGGQYDEEVRSLAMRKAKATGRPVDMLEALAESQEEKDERVRQEQAERQRQEEHERDRRKRVVARAKYVARPVDPFDARDGVPDRGAGFTKAKPATSRQIEWLEKHGIDASDWTRGEAGQKIDEVIKRLADGLCTPKQADLLRRFGENPDGVSRDKASVLIDLIKARGWKALDYDLTRDRWFLRERDDGSWGLSVQDTVAGRVRLPRTFSTEAVARAFAGECMESVTVKVPA